MGGFGEVHFPVDVFGTARIFVTLSQDVTRITMVMKSNLCAQVPCCHSVMMSFCGTYMQMEDLTNSLQGPWAGTCLLLMGTAELMSSPG